MAADKKRRRSGRPKPWEPHEDMVLVEKYGEYTAPQLQEKYLKDRTVRAIYMRLSNLGLTQAPPERDNTDWSDEETEALKANYGKMSARELHQKHLPGRTVSAIREKARKLGLSQASPNKPDRSKPSKFALWTPEETETLKQNASRLSRAELQALLPEKTLKQINQKASSLGLIDENRIEWTDKEIEALRTNAPTHTMKELRGILAGRDETSIRSKLRTLGIECKLSRKPPSKKEKAKWNDGDIEKLRRLAPGRTPYEIAESFPGRTDVSVRLECDRLGIAYKQSAPRWSDAEVEILEKNRAGCSIAGLQALLPGRSRDSIKKRLRKLREQENEESETEK